MSRIGKQPIEIPAGIDVSVDGSVVTVKGSRGELTQNIPGNISLKIEAGLVTIERGSEEKKDRSFHGLVRSLVANMVEGVSKGFEKTLIVTVVGYKANVSGDTLKLSLGFSHDINFTIPNDIKVVVEKSNITISGIDKQKVGQVAAKIRAFRKPEPYKGKGIRYIDEIIIRKSGKTAGA